MTVMMSISMEVSVSLSFLMIHLEGNGSIRETRNKEIHKGKGGALFYLHCKLDVRGKVVEVMEKILEGKKPMRPHYESVINKPIPTFRFHM